MSLKSFQDLKENGIEFCRPADIDPLLCSLITVLGPEGYLALGNGELAFTDPKVREAFELYGDAFVSSYMFGWSGYGGLKLLTSLQGNAAMYLNGDW